MGILTWIILGMIAGSIANMIDPAPSRGGLLGSMILGIVGAIVGGFLAGLLLGTDGVSGFNLSSIVVATIGSLIVLWGARSFRHAV
jgi:uncharacterized membrane protein YeaQ/YmgE (transglycosylase-associated protein family)